ncbi:MAG TPA: insulinase family protein [Bacteroidetes bacterium]|nr:insulinase family protein [Bacteroidota bacterium]
MKTRLLILPGIIALLLGACSTQEKQSELKIDYEKYQLDNGLDVILHQDKSDPIVAVAIQYHVGSNREVPGRTGFAHLFEHMMFQQSENVGQDQFFKLIQGAGGTLNGGTNKDGTIYFEVVPKNAIEMVLWAESDRMGYLSNTVTASAFANQQNVVQNEKRQSYDNRPYGHTSYVIDKNLFPEGHPYSWQVIGEMEDLFNATVEDVKEFHAKYYVPNNATLTIAGDFDKEEIKALVNRYFGEIPGGEKVNDLDPMPVTLTETKKLYHEDNFARTPELTMVWPTVEQYHPDSYALDFLGQLLGSGKKAPFYKVLVKERKMTSRARVYNNSSELAGKFNISVNAYPGFSLAEVENAVYEAFDLFEEEGITENDLERIKAGLETRFYNGMSSILGKSFQLARYNEYAGDPGFVTEDLQNIQSVTIDDIMRVYEKYIKGKPFVATSFVPKGKVDLIAEGAVDAGIVEENVLEATEVDQSQIAENEIIEKTETSFDRSVIPAIGPDPELTLPGIWKGELDNGIRMWGIKHDELPLVSYNLKIKGSHLLEDPDKAGTASLMAQLMNEGTANKTPEELEEAIDLLGASIRIHATGEAIVVSVNTLSRNFEKTVNLVEEMLLEPRWDTTEFELAKESVINSFPRNRANPSYMASRALSRLMYGEDHIFSVPFGGTEETVPGISMDDLKEFYNTKLSPSLASFHIVGDIDRERVETALASLGERWEKKDLQLPEIEIPGKPDQSTIYFVDFPGAKQSVILIGNLSIPRNHPDYYPAYVANYKLGGSFNGIVNLILREEKGYTYGARTGFSGGLYTGTFTASSSVRTTATLESVQIFKEEMEKYRNGISQEDIDFTKEALLKSNARAFETQGSLLSMLSNISQYDLPHDYIKEEEEFVRSLTIDKHKELVNKYIDPSRMYYVIAGDAETQVPELKKLGLGDPVMVEL